MQAILPDLASGPSPPPEEPRRPASRFIGRLALPIQIAGLLAGAWALFLALGRQPHFFTWAGLAGHALRYAVLTWVCSAAVTFLLYFMVPAEERRDVAWNTLRTSSVAVWFAPAIILLTALSPEALAAGLVLVVKATRLLYSEWQVAHPLPPPATYAPVVEGLFADYYLPPRSFAGEIAPALICACLSQFGVVEFGMQEPLAAAVLLVAGAATLTIQALSRGAWTEQRPASLPRSFLGASLTILLAAGLTVTGLRGRVVEGGQGGGSSATSLREWLRQFLGKDQPAGGPDNVLEAKSKGAGNTDAPQAQPPQRVEPAVAGGTFPGVILRPEVQPVVTLIAPLPAVKNGFPSATRTAPFSIPFGGEYWMYRWLAFRNRPPPNSILERGTPAELSFRTVDRWPLQMEAHQKLVQPIDLRCCSEVQVEIRNADKDAEAITVELVAIGGDGGAQSLGTAPVTSRPDATRDPITPVPETLDFAVPASLPAGMVDEFKVVFRRARLYGDKSSRIAVARFLLVPR